MALLESVQRGQLAPAAAAMQLRERSAGYQQVRTCNAVRHRIEAVAAILRVSTPCLIGCLCRKESSRDVHCHSAELTGGVTSSCTHAGAGFCTGGQLAHAADANPGGRAGC